MNITREEVDAAIEESVEVWKSDFYIDLVALCESLDHRGASVNSSIYIMRDQGYDLSWFDENYPYEMNHPLCYVTESEIRDASDEQKEVWGRVAGVATSIYNSLD
jgi:hypothetical protein